LTENLHQAAKSTQEDVDAALDAAHEAFPTWRKLLLLKEVICY
jgi:acyl-CoA reductase-like NAD-dependent aldehyde dehydrogenase